MRVLKRARCTLEFGGPDSGWRPPGSAPYTTQSQLLTLEIHDSDDGFFLYSIPDGGGMIGDTWHPTLDDALSQAESQFGVAQSEWVEVTR
jgi:hypothetical protein